MDMMLDRWWLVALRGLAAIAFGVITFAAPLASTTALGMLFGGYALVDGGLYVMLALHEARRHHLWKFLGFAGGCGVVAGVVALLSPGISPLVLLFVMAVWAIATGIASMKLAVQLRQQIEGERLLGASGLLAILFGVLLGMFPGSGVLSLAMWIGAWAVVFGAVLLALSFRLRLQRKAPHGAPTGALPTAA